MMAKPAAMAMCGVCLVAGPLAAQQPNMRTIQPGADVQVNPNNMTVSTANLRKLGPAPVAMNDKLKRLATQKVQATSADLGASGIVYSGNPAQNAGDVMVLLEGRNVDWKIGFMTGESLVSFNPKSSGEESRASLHLLGLAGRRALIDCQVNDQAVGGTFEFGYANQILKVPVEAKRAAFMLPLKQPGVVTIKPSYKPNGNPDFALKGCEVTILKK